MRVNEREEVSMRETIRETESGRIVWPVVVVVVVGVVMFFSRAASEKVCDDQQQQRQ